jgi:hypothetical protein
LRIRTALLVSTAIAATWFGSDAASALEVGPVSVPVSVPAVSVTVPPALTVGPVTVPVSQVAPGLGASATVSPQTGVGVTVSLPSSIGGVPVLPGAPHDVQVGVDSGGAGVTLPPGSSSGVSGTGSQLSASPPGAARYAGGATSPSGAAARRLVPAAPAAANAVDAGRHAGSRASPPPSPAVERQPGAVNASLQPQGSGGLWSLLRDLASAHGLWIVLLLIVAIARVAAGGLMRDAFRRRAAVSP